MNTIELTPRQVDICREIATGATNEEIAARLYLSVDTVKTHVQKIRRKLGVHGRAAIVASAFRSGAIQ